MTSVLVVLEIYAATGLFPIAISCGIGPAATADFLLRRADFMLYGPVHVGVCAVAVGVDGICLICEDLLRVCH